MKTIHTIVLATAFLSLLIAACSQPPSPTRPKLESQFGTPGYDEGLEVSPGSKSIYLSGRWNDGSKLFKFGRAGNIPWFKSLHPQRGYDTVALLGMAQTSAGDALALIGSAYDDYSGDDVYPVTYVSYVLRKVAPSSRTLWERTVQSRTTACICGNETEFVQDRSGNLYVALNLSRNNLRKYSASGVLLWQKTTAGELRELAVSPDGSIYTSEVTLRGDNATTSLVRYSASGTRLWAKTVPFVILELSAARTSEVYLSGTNTDAYPNSLNYLAKYSNQGRQGWLKTLRQSDYGWRADSLAVDTQGNVVLALSDFYTEGIVKKYTAAGSRLWRKSIAKPISDVAVLGTSEIYLTGSTEGKVNGVNYGLTDGYLLHLNGRGGQVWMR